MLKLGSTTSGVKMREVAVDLVPLDADDPRMGDLGEPQSIDLDSTGSTTGPPATPISRATPKPSRKKTFKAHEASRTAGTEANAIANARLRDPESQCHMVVLRDASRDEHGFSVSHHGTLAMDSGGPRPPTI